MEKRVSLIQVFLIFAKMGAFTIGGGYAMIPLIEKELLKREWISSDELQDIIVLAQSAPGLLSQHLPGGASGRGRPYSRTCRKYGQGRLQELVGISDGGSNTFRGSLFESVTDMDYLNHHSCGCGHSTYQAEQN